MRPAQLFMEILLIIKLSSKQAGRQRDPAYLNCPMNKNEYINFRKELILGEQASLKDFDKESANFLKLFTY